MFKSVAEFPDLESAPELWHSALHCHICSDIHTRAIFYCEGGHLICQKCSTPTGTGSALSYTSYGTGGNPRCSCARKITKVRAEYLEQIVRATRFHCEHECGQSLTNEEYAFHVEEACRFRPINCPLCATLVDYKNYLRHLRRVHNVGSFDLDENGEAGLLIARDTEPMYICVYEEKTFFLRWERESSKFWVQSFQNTRGISVQVETTTFRCNIRISKAHSGLNCPDADVLRLVMNEKVRLKFKTASEYEIWTGPPSASASNRNSAISPVTTPSGGAKTFTNRTSAMSITSSSSDGTGAEHKEPITVTLEEAEEPGSPAPPLPEEPPPIVPPISGVTDAGEEEDDTFFDLV